jgi:alpha/beta hydrolase family protein
MPTRLIAVLVALILASAPAFARVVEVVVNTKEDVLNGKVWDKGGVYEKLVGKVYFAVDPKNAHNGRIVDLNLADKNKDGDVEFSADFYILRPKNGGNGTLLLEIPNRGGKGMLRIIQGATGHNTADPIYENDYGDGFLMKRGYTIAWIGWQFDIPAEDKARLHLTAPIAHNGAAPIRGLVRADWTLSAPRDVMPLGHLIGGIIGGAGYAVADPQSDKNVLTVRECPTPEGTPFPTKKDNPPTCARKVIVRTEWEFSGLDNNGHFVPSDRFVRLKSGFQPGKVYEIVYEAKDPAVVGLGFAAVRDFVSYLKHAHNAVAPVKTAYAMGISQCGRFLRHFLYQDFNADESDRLVLDGVLAHVAGAGRGSFNHRFAQPSRDAQPTSSLFFPTDLFPFTDTPETDPLTNATAGLLDASNAAKHTPKVFLTNTSYEYWSRAASLIHTTADAKQDVTPGPNVRIYLFDGLQHFSGPFPPTAGQGDYEGQQKTNPLPIRWFWRAMITNMDAWVKNGAEPPPSAYPKLANRTLVPVRWLVFPKIPNVNVPATTLGAYHLDFGPEWKEGVVTKEPPGVGPPYPTLVPQSDNDGNDTGGIRLPEIEVPLATYTAWNLRSPDIGMSFEKASFIGSFIPFAKTAAEREKSGDPRFSIAERYRNRQQYMQRFTDATNNLVKQRWLLPEDVPAVVERGAQTWDLVTK